MKLIGKGLMLLTVFFIGIIFVNAAQPEDCNNIGGIWCGPLFGGRCEYPVTNLPLNFDTDYCLVSVTDQLVKATFGSLNYSLYSFKIDNNIKLRFVSPNTVSLQCIYSETGGSGGEQQTNKPQNGGYYGGAGGSGGNTCKVGNYGNDAEHTDWGGGYRAGIPGYIAPFVIIQAHDVNISGTLDISGWPGSVGGDAHDDDDDGYGGGGASGGSGGGILYLYSINITGTGVINVSGGKGGRGGQFNDDGGDQCESSDDPGTGGGGGGGGGGGSIFVSSTPLPSIIMDCSGGASGLGGCHHTSLAEVGLPGSAGTSSTSCGTLASLGSENECNDMQDNDLDGATDMSDSDCQTSTCPAYNSDLLINGAAPDGSDGCCGDDSGDSSILFDEPFNDNSNGWQPGPNAQPVIIANGHLRLPSPTMIAKKTIPFSSTDKKLVFIVNDSSLYSPSKFRIEFLDNSGTGIFVNNNEVSLEGCTRLGLSGDPNRLYGVMMPSSASGIERTCSITIHSSMITDLLLMFSTDGADSRIDYVKVIERPYSGDYGYVTPDNKWLCYNNLSKFVSPDNSWNWIHAPESAFKITPVNLSGKIVDYISNTENWYYCDANHVPGLAGLPIPEYNTFPNPEFGGLEMTCSGFATYLTSLITQYPYEDCATAQGPNCCVDGGSFNVLENPEMLGECYCRTASVTGSEELFCSIEENKILSICSDYSFTEDKILTEFCNQNPRNCVTLDHYDTTLSCDAQPFNSGHDCSVTQVCSNGVILPVLNGEPCCVGVSASCIEKSQITNQQICEESGGRPYTPSNTTYCLPKNQSIQMSVEEGACCFGAILHTDNFPFSSFENLNNNTFSCFAYQGNNLFGQCCYDNCNTMTQFSPIYVDATRNRAFSIKLPFNIQTSYDLYNSSAGILQDYSHTTTTPNFTFYQVAYFNGKKNTSMAYYDNLEFDIIYNQEANVQKIYINDVDYGPITTYVNNGNKRGISHHIKIPLRIESKMQDLGQIKVVTNPASVKVLYDNIYFSINSDTPESSLNYYCTGGFAAWIKDLDSEITDPNDAFFTSENSYIEGYGRYAVACDAYLPYGWTGHYCCGDDTNQTNYGEYYEDVLNPTWPTTGGCFRGSTVIDGETVWKIKGYIEDHTDMFTSDDELKSYYYSDLIYTDDSFVGCQIPTSKYADLKVSYDGRTQTATNLINDVISDSCTVVGTYYCMNGIWRQHVSGLNQEYSELNNIYLPSIPSSLELKSVPPATELIKNGDFGGECPPTICNYQQ